MDSGSGERNAEEQKDSGLREDLRARKRKRTSEPLTALRSHGDHENLFTLLFMIMTDPTMPMIRAKTP